MITVEEEGRLSCSEHKRYKGVGAPTSPCPECQMIYMYEERGRLVEAICEASDAMDPSKLAKCIDKAEELR